MEKAATILHFPERQRPEKNAVRQRVGGNRAANDRLRPRKHLTRAEVAKLVDVASRVGRHGPRDALAILLAANHGLRASELCGLEWAQFDLKAGTLLVRRLKGSSDSTHELSRSELHRLHNRRREQGDGARFVFTTERGGPMTVAGFQAIVRRAGELAKIPFPVHPHQLRHTCGFLLAEAGMPTRSIQLWLGHKNLAHTAVYTSISSSALRGTSRHLL